MNLIPMKTIEIQNCILSPPGGTMVSHMALSPQASGLFHRVIGLSGSAAAWYAEAILALDNARNMGLVNFCTILNTKYVLLISIKMQESPPA